MSDWLCFKEMEREREELLLRDGEGNTTSGVILNIRLNHLS